VSLLVDETRRDERMRSCDSSNCLLCCKQLLNGRVEGYIEKVCDSIAQAVKEKDDVLSYAFTSKRGTSSGVGGNENEKEKDGASVSTSGPAAAEAAAAVELSAWSGTTSRSSTESFDQMVPQHGDNFEFRAARRSSSSDNLLNSSSVVPDCVGAERKEAYMARETCSGTSDKVISSIDFRFDATHFGCATTCKELCIYKLDCGDASTRIDPICVHKTAAKLSSLVWNNNSNLCTVGDHYGEMTRIDVETGHILEEIEEGSGTPILDLKRNKYFGTSCMLTATKSGSVKLWSGDLMDSMHITHDTSCVPVCSVAFSPVNPNHVALALADATFCIYDIRNVDSGPFCKNNVGSDNPVAHIDYCSNGDVVCSTLRNGITVWGETGHQVGNGSLKRSSSMTLWKKCSFGGHTQKRHFVGLAINESDLIATGSEDDKAYIYSRDSMNAIAVCEGDKAYSPTSASGRLSPVTAVEWIPHYSPGVQSRGLLVASGISIKRFDVGVV